MHYMAKSSGVSCRVQHLLHRVYMLLNQLPSKSTNPPYTKPTQRIRMLSYGQDGSHNDTVKRKYQEKTGENRKKRKMKSKWKKKRKTKIKWKGNEIKRTSKNEMKNEIKKQEYENEKDNKTKIGGWRQRWNKGDEEEKEEKDNPNP